jgi:hypothetical protein
VQTQVSGHYSHPSDGAHGEVLQSNDAFKAGMLILVWYGFYQKKIIIIIIIKLNLKKNQTEF